MSGVGEQAWPSAFGIGARAHPAPLPKLLDEDAVAAHRRLGCELYNDCLDLAIHSAWTSWSCQDCQLAVLAVAPPVDEPGAARPGAA